MEEKELKAEEEQEEEEKEEVVVVVVVAAAAAAAAVVVEVEAEEEKKEKKEEEEDDQGNCSCADGDARLDHDASLVAEQVERRLPWKKGKKEMRGKRRVKARECLMCSNT